MITIACVMTGEKYRPVYVERLRNMVERNLAGPVEFICLTDRPASIAAIDRIETIDISKTGLSGWWPKMLLLDPAVRGNNRTIYFDLDTVIAGRLELLADLDVDFGICANFARLHGAHSWPCNYGSCVMTFAPGWGAPAFKRFWSFRHQIMETCGRFGDQMAIEKLVPDAAILQRILPDGYFLNKREFSARRPPAASVLVFGGKVTPKNVPYQWIKDLWR